MKTPCQEWQWFGHAGHLCVSDDCRFHLCTKVGDYLVSTVGDYRPRHKWSGENIPDMAPIGGGALELFETYVFRLVTGTGCTDANCGCGLPNIDPCQIDGTRAATAGEAARNHIVYCEKYADRGVK